MKRFCSMIWDLWVSLLQQLLTSEDGFYFMLLLITFSSIKVCHFHLYPSFPLRSTLVGVTATTLWCSFLPRSITWRTYELSIGWTALLLVYYSLDVLPKRPDLWNIRFATVRCRRNMCVEWKENFPGAVSSLCFVCSFFLSSLPYNMSISLFQSKCSIRCKIVLPLSVSNISYFP